MRKKSEDNSNNLFLHRVMASKMNAISSLSHGFQMIANLRKGSQIKVVPACCSSMMRKTFMHLEKKKERELRFYERALSLQFFGQSESK